MTKIFLYPIIVLGGAGGIEGRAMKKKLALKGGPAKKLLSVRGDHSKNYPKML